MELDHHGHTFELAPAGREKLERLLYTLRDRWELVPKGSKLSMHFLYRVHLSWADGEHHTIQLGGVRILGLDATVQLTPTETSVVADCIGDPRLEYRDYPRKTVEPSRGGRKQ